HECQNVVDIVGNFIVDIGAAGETATDHVNSVAIEMFGMRWNIGTKPFPATRRAMQHDQHWCIRPSRLDVASVDASGSDPLLTGLGSYHMGPDTSVLVFLDRLFS